MLKNDAVESSQISCIYIYIYCRRSVHKISYTVITYSNWMSSKVDSLHQLPFKENLLD